LAARDEGDIATGEWLRRAKARDASRKGVALVLLLAAVARLVSAGEVAELPSQMTTERGLALVREISASVEQLRGLRFTTPVAMQVISGATARENFKAMIDPQSEEESRHVQNAYAQLGLVPRGTDLTKASLDLAEKGVDGYYEPGSKTFFLLDHVAPADVRGIIAHELTHALEDQNYDLVAVQKKAEGDADRATAIRSLIEGSAMVVMFAFLSREQGQSEAKAKVAQSQTARAQRLKIAPTFTQRSLVLPYLLGFSFLLHGKPWDWALGNGVLITDIAKAYANLPLSTREILHPEQYWGGHSEHRGRLRLPDLSTALGKGWSKAAEGSIGELGLSVLAGSRDPIEASWALLPTRWTNEASTGTTGDVFQHYVNGTRSMTVLLTRWETERDAHEFEAALVNKGRYYTQFGVNILVLAGDIEDRGEAVALAALQGANYGPDK
jgi:hypothetical protein